MSGELGLAGYRFQYHVMVLAALDLWGQDPTVDVEAIVVEGRPDAEKVDYEIVGRGVGNSALVQVKGRWGSRPWSAPEIARILTDLGHSQAGSARLELVVNGGFSGPAQRLVALLATAPVHDDGLERELVELGIELDPERKDLAALRRAVVTIRSTGLPQLREEVRLRLRRLRAACGCGVGDQAAELLRAYLLGLAMDKTEAADTAGRTFHRDEFLAAVKLPRSSLEEALASRWGVPVGLAHRDRSVQREALLDELGDRLKDADGVHAADGRVRSCVLAGPAGIGKTTLAQQYALHNAGEFDWIYQITAQADDDATPSEQVLREELEQFAAWLTGRGVDVHPGPYQSLYDVGRVIAEALAACPRSWFLIVDNVTAADTIATLLPAAGHGSIVITSRNSTWHAAQPVIHVRELTPDEGRTLVQRRLGDAATDDAQVDALCRELEYLPLSLVTATSYLHSTQEQIGGFFATLQDQVDRLKALGFSRLRLDDYPRNAVAAVRMVLSRLRSQVGESSRHAIRVLQRTAVVFPDRIPVPLVAEDRQLFNESIAVLGEFSLVTRWQDSEQRDWLRVHRIIQDVVRAELDADADTRAAVLREVEGMATDLLKAYTDQFDFVAAGALRLHAITVAERLDRHGLSRWESTTALLANAASVSRAQGDIAETRQRLDQALALLPADSYDALVAGRRGRTLLSLAQLHLDRNEREVALEILKEARRVHDLHRFIPSHNEALAEVLAIQYQVEAHLARDEQHVMKLFEQARALPELSDEVALLRAVSLVKIARCLDNNADRQSRFAECAERLFELVRYHEARQAMPAAMAHLTLAESHGLDGGGDAAWRHYRRGIDLLVSVQGIDPAQAPSEALELALGLVGAYLDKETDDPRPDVGSLIEKILADVERQLGELDWEATQRDWLPIRFHAIKAMHLAGSGDVSGYTEHLKITGRLADACVTELPATLAFLVTGLPELRRHARIQQVRMHTPKVGIYGPRPQGESRSLSQGAAPCHHFDVDALHVPHSEQEQPNLEPSRPTAVAVDRPHAIECHSALLLQCELPPQRDGHSTRVLFRDVCGNPQEAANHLIGAWRLLDTMSYKISHLTGHSIEHVREELDHALTRWHHDTETDTVPARVVLRCLNNDWFSELNNVLTQLDDEATTVMLISLIHAEQDLATQIADLEGNSVDATIRQCAELAASFERGFVYSGERTYDPATGRIVTGRDLLGKPQTVRLHDPNDIGVQQIFIFGDEQSGKSNTLHIISLQTAISGVFYVIAADPRNEHDLVGLWRRFAGGTTWTTANVADTLASLEAVERIIDVRTHEGGYEHPTRTKPGILLALDDADDVLRLPRGRSLIERIVTDGPAVSVGLAAVIRDPDRIGDNVSLGRSIVNSPNTTYLGHDGADNLRRFRATYGA